MQEKALFPEALRTPKHSPQHSGLSIAADSPSFTMPIARLAALFQLPAAQWLGLLTAILNGAAGALVYLFEKSAVESEARNYDEMQHVFASAEQMLDATGQAAHVAPGERLARQHRILRELGRAALAENSYWLRAHRERPVEPIAGG